MKTSTILEKREKFSLDRVSQLRERIGQWDDVALTNPGLCIYVTGSFGRLEASEFSDLDLFFLNEHAESPLSRIDKILLDAKLIKLGREMGHPEFSDDARYLTIHDLKSMLIGLGSPNDDFGNYFTARLLLLLESKCLHNDVAYQRIIQEVVKTYYRDYDGHEPNFQPVFIINDIIRFWKTLCLNYEYQRNDASVRAEVKHKMQLKNLKLKFSRMLTCYSMVAWLIKNKMNNSPSEIAKAASLTPMVRLDQVSDRPDLKSIFEVIKYNYSWFLEKTGKEKSDVIQWISETKAREGASEKALHFGRALFKLISKISNENTLQYLVI